MNTTFRTQLLRRFAFFVIACVSLVSPDLAFSQQGGTADAIVEQGKFTLHKFEQAIGEETYEIHRDGDSLAVKMEFKFTDRGRAVPLSATFRGAPDLTPQAFEIKGNTARTASIDEAVTIDFGKVHTRSRDNQTDSAAPTSPFFTIA